MIVYDPFWRTLQEKGLTTYQLIHKYGYSSHTIHRLRHNGGISTGMIDGLCTLLDCTVQEILIFVPDEKEK